MGVISARMDELDGCISRDMDQVKNDAELEQSYKSLRQSIHACSAAEVRTKLTRKHFKMSTQKLRPLITECYTSFMEEYNTKKAYLLRRMLDENTTLTPKALIIIIIIILAVHATAGRWPPQLAPCTSILGRSHPLTANGFLDVISPSPFGSSS